eukprot:TCONS_00063018-protein
MTEISQKTGAYNVHDTLRQGFSHALSGTISHHAVEKSEKNHAVNAVKQELKSARTTHGVHMAMKLQMERSIVSQAHRMPGLPCSYLSLRTLTGENDLIGPEDIFNEIPENLVDYRMLGEAKMGF